MNYPYISFLYCALNIVANSSKNFCNASPNFLSYFIRVWAAEPASLAISIAYLKYDEPTPTNIPDAADWAADFAISSADLFLLYIKSSVKDPAAEPIELPIIVPAYRPAVVSVAVPSAIPASVPKHDTNPFMNPAPKGLPFHL